DQQGQDHRSGQGAVRAGCVRRAALKRSEMRGRPTGRPFFVYSKSAGGTTLTLGLSFAWSGEAGEPSGTLSTSVEPAGNAGEAGPSGLTGSRGAGGGSGGLPVGALAAEDLRSAEMGFCLGFAPVGAPQASYGLIAAGM